MAPQWIAYSGQNTEDSTGGIATFSNGDIATAYSVSKANGASSVLVQRLNNSGEIVWTLDIGADFAPGAGSVLVGADDKVYVVGGTKLDADGESGKNDSDVFAAAISSMGSKLWYKNYGVGIHEIGSTAVLDANGNIVLNGRVSEVNDAYTMIKDVPNFYGAEFSGGWRGFQLKINPLDGSVSKAYTTGSGNSGGELITVDQLRNIVFVGGYTFGAVNGVNTVGNGDPAGANKYLIARNETSGAVLWTRMENWIRSNLVTQEAEDAIYFVDKGILEKVQGSTGVTQWTKPLSNTDYRLSPIKGGGILLSETKSTGALTIRRFDSTGNESGSQVINHTGDLYPHSFIENGDGILIVSGSTTGSITTPSGATIKTAKQAGSDAFVLQVNSSFSAMNPAPTYTLTPSSATINEGAVLTNAVTTTNVATGTKLYYALSGTGINAADFSAGALTGEGVTDSTGKVSFTHTLANDQITEGAETVEIKLFSDVARKVQVGSTATVTVKDTSNPVVRGNSLYTIVDGPSWTQAEANSVKLGGHLVAVNNKEENEWVVSLTSNSSNHSSWIGFTDEKQEGQWSWSDASDPTFTSWDSPTNPSQNDVSENYVGILSGIKNHPQFSSWGKNKGMWHDFRNVGDGNSPSVGIAETPFIRRGDSAYVIVQGPTWEEAEANAVKLGGHLVTINDAAENQWISDTFRDRLALPDKNWNNGLRTGSWIGLNDKEVDGVPKWADGSEVTYTNYMTPSNVSGTSGVFDGWLSVMLDPSGSAQRNGGLNSWHDGPATSLPDYTLYTTGIAEIKLAPNNTPTGTPTVTGTLKVGSTLTIDATAIKDSDNFTGYTPTFKYNWETSIDGTTWSKLTSTDAADNNNTYILTATEANKKIRGVVSYLDGYGTNEAVNSAASTETNTIIPAGSTWEYLFADQGAPESNWKVSSGGWKSGNAPFSSETTVTDENSEDWIAATYWRSGIQSAAGEQLWVRKKVDLSGYDLSKIQFHTGVDNGLKLYVNGALVFSESSHGFASRWEYERTIPESVLRSGENIFAIALNDEGGHTAFDFLLTSDPNSTLPIANVIDYSPIVLQIPTLKTATVSNNQLILTFSEDIKIAGGGVVNPAYLTVTVNGQTRKISGSQSTGSQLVLTLSGLSLNSASSVIVSYNPPNTSTSNQGFITNLQGTALSGIASLAVDTLGITASTTLSGISLAYKNLVLLGTGSITGSGNALNNIITGNDGNNILNGLGGSDAMSGGKGDDTYFVDNVGDVVTELGSEGTDTVQSSVSWTLADNLENLTLLGSGAINGTGNSGNNIITGNNAANILNGMGGTNTLIGDRGSDTYIVDSADNIIIESGSLWEVDTVQSSVSWILGSNLEILNLTGSSAINGTGNNLNNTLTGNSANNILDGGNGGTDRLTGLAGADVFRFLSRPSSFSTTSADHITDFSSAQGDKIHITKSAFEITASTPTLSVVSNVTALDAALAGSALFVYNTSNGELHWNQNGTTRGAGSGGILAILDNKSSLTSGDLMLV